LELVLRRRKFVIHMFTRLLAPVTLTLSRRT